MIPDELRQAILTLKRQGRALREISRLLKVSRNTIRRALRAPAARTPREHPQHQTISAVMPALYQRCAGNAVRIQELLESEHGIALPYSSLTRLIRRQALRGAKRRSDIYRFAPGEEMQHDTSPHRLTLGEKTITAPCASLVLAYSR